MADGEEQPGAEQEPEAAASEAETPAADAGASDEAAVAAASFPDLDGAGDVSGSAPNLDMVRDINVTLTVELGRTDMLIQEILELTPGKVVELQKLAGEPLDILINGRVLARGEVVVVDENFGVRITAITDPRSRVHAMGPNAEPPMAAS